MVRRWNRINSPVHALAYQCDLLYDQMCDNVISVLGAFFMEFGNGKMNSQCLFSIRMFARDNDDFLLLMDDYLSCFI